MKIDWKREQLADYNQHT